MPKKVRSLIVLASFAALLVLPARGMAETYLGFTDDFKRTARAAPVVQGTSQVARLTISWRGVMGAGWSEVDEAVNAARASGQKVLLTIYDTQMPDLGQWTAFLGALHARYP